MSYRLHLGDPAKRGDFVNQRAREAIGLDGARAGRLESGAQLRAFERAAEDANSQLDGGQTARD